MKLAIALLIAALGLQAQTVTPSITLDAPAAATITAMTENAQCTFGTPGYTTVHILCVSVADPTMALAVDAPAQWSSPSSSVGSFSSHGSTINWVLWQGNGLQQYTVTADGITKSGTFLEPGSSAMLDSAARALAKTAGVTGEPCPLLHFAGDCSMPVALGLIQAALGMNIVFLNSN
jgi:hypothetical protein